MGSPRAHWSRPGAVQASWGYCTGALCDYCRPTVGHCGVILSVLQALLGSPWGHPGGFSVKQYVSRSGGPFAFACQQR